MSIECQMPIDFYGIFLDQDGKPVEGVKVRYTTNPPKGGMTVNDEVCYSGADGKFEIHGQHGLSLFFLLDKEGYTQIGDINSSDYDFINYEKPNFYVADPQQPTVIRLLQRPALEPLSIWRGHVPYLKAEEKFYIDPETGQTSTQKTPEAIWISISPELEDSAPGKRGAVKGGIDGAESLH